MLRVDEDGFAPSSLRLGDDVLTQGGLARRFGPVDLGHPAAGNAAHTQGDVQGEAAGGDDVHVLVWAFSQSHDCTLAEATADVAQRAYE